MSVELSAPPSAQPCSACPALVYWAKNDKTWKPAPIDAVNDPAGNIITFHRGESREKYYRVIGENERRGFAVAGTPMHTNHFATCPNAKQFRGRK